MEEIAIARNCLQLARESGAEQVRITLNKSVTNLAGMLNGELDKVSRSLDRSLALNLFVDGRYGSFSTNRLDEAALPDFVRESIATVRMLAPDPCRALPDPARTAKDAQTGRELDLFDPAVDALTLAERLSIAERSCLFARKSALEKGFTLLSEEGEYSDSLFDTVVLDSNGLFARHTETSFEIGYELTIASPDGFRYSGFWWDASPRLEQLQWRDCSEKALQRAAAQIGPQPDRGGRMNLVVDSECASKLLNPLLAALGGYAVQQKNSFLADKLGEALFPPCLSVVDRPHEAGQTGSRLFDSEGVATRERPIIDKGVVSTFFLNSYIARKLGMEPTVEDAVRPCVVPFGGCRTREDVLRKMDSGILVTGFNGGNSNSSTGDFSYGIEGFRFAGGKIVHPVREMLVTGNFITLWKQLALTGDDARPCLSRRIPTLAFTGVDFSG